MNKITGFSVMTTGEGKRVTVNYSVLDDAGNIRDTNLRANYVALDDAVLAAIATIEQDAATGTAGNYSLVTIISTLAWGLGYFGMPHILLRFMAIEDPDKLTISRRVASVWVVVSMGMAVLIGIIGSAMIGSGVIAPIAFRQHPATHRPRILSRRQ